MSWEAVSWANRQKLKLPQEQLVLLVLANCADPDGVAFARWRGRDHWWHYLAERTRLSKASLFRHLNTLEEIGLATRSSIVLADGGKAPVVALDLAARFDVEEIEESQSHGETGAHDASQEGENTSDISENEASISPEDFQSHGETESHGETGAASSSLTVRPVQSHGETGTLDSNIGSKSSPPLPPSGGTAVRDDLWEGPNGFLASWLEPIPKMALAKSAWDHTETAKHAEIVAAAKGYWAWLKGHSKPPSAQSAQSFIRDASGWAQWLRYTPDASGSPAKILSGYPVESPEAKAVAVLWELIGKTDFFRSIKCRAGQVYHAHPLTPRLLALANAPPRTGWVRLDRQQAAAWEDLATENLPQITRTRLTDGSSAPWHWPPRKDGTLSPTGPPTMTEADHEALANEGQM